MNNSWGPYTTRPLKLSCDLALRHVCRYCDGRAPQDLSFTPFWFTVHLVRHAMLCCFYFQGHSGSTFEDPVTSHGTAVTCSTNITASLLCTLQIHQKICFKLTHLSNEPTVGGNGNFRQALERCTYTLKQCFWAKLGPYSIVMCQLSCGKDALYQQLLHRQPTQLIIFLTVSPLQFLTASTTNRSTTTSTTTSSPLPFIAYRYYMPAGWLLF